MTRLKRFSVDHLYLVVVAGAVFVVVYALWNALQTEPPIHYTQATYEPNKAVYAPGETLIYTPSLQVAQEGWTDFLRTFWDATRDSSAKLCDGSDAPQDAFSRNLPRGILGNARGGRAVSVVVPKMPPGDYILQSSAVKHSGGGQGYYEVKFSITQAC
jgi:hypothetical protein